MSRRRRGRGGGGGLLIVGAVVAGLWLVVEDPAAVGLTTAPSPVAVGDIPTNYLALYHRAGNTCPGLDWALLAGVGKVETDHGRSRMPGVRSGANSAGAAGPMQFLAPTWRQVRAAHPELGADVYDPRNAIPGAAHYLCDSGLGPGARATRAALWAYNHSSAYADQVLTRATRYRAGGAS